MFQQYKQYAAAKLNNQICVFEKSWEILYALLITTKYPASVLTFPNIHLLHCFLIPCKQPLFLFLSLAVCAVRTHCATVSCGSMFGPSSLAWGPLFSGLAYTDVGWSPKTHGFAVSKPSGYGGNGPLEAVPRTPASLLCLTCCHRLSMKPV